MAIINLPNCQIALDIGQKRKLFSSRQFSMLQKEKQWYDREERLIARGVLVIAAIRFWRKLPILALPSGYRVKKFLVAFLLLPLWCFLIAPVLAEKPPEKPVVKAPVMVDGQELFRVSNSGEFLAAERAKNINYLLQEKLRSPAPLEVKIYQNEEIITLRINDRHLVTVTPADTIPGMALTEQAQIWQEILEQAIAKAEYQRTPAYLSLATKQTVGVIIAGVAIQCLLFWIGRRYRHQQLQRSETKSGSRQLLALLLLRIGIGIAVIYYIASLFPWSRRWLYQTFQLLNATFAAEIFTFGEESLSLNKFILIIILIIGLWCLVDLFTKLLKSSILPLAGVDKTIEGSIAYFTRYGLLFFGSLIILVVGGVDFRSLAILVSVLGVGVGFGLQNIAKDFISGFIMMFDRPIKVGELVQVGDFQGLVQRIGPRATEVSTIERVIVMIPNSRFIEGEVQNWNRSGLTRVKVYVGIAYGADINLVHRVLLAAAQVPHPDILRHPPPKVKFRSFGDNSLNFRVVVFIRDPLKEPKVRSHVYDQVEVYLRKYNIEIPFPQRTLHVNLPQFEELMLALQQSNQLSKTAFNSTDSVRTSFKSKPHQDPIPELPVIQPEYDWQAIASAMRGEDGVEIKDRRSGLKTFSKCFVGSDAVNWLMVHEKATRVEAVLMGELMVAEGLIHHVLDEHGFKDAPFFYRFYADEQTPKAPKESAFKPQEIDRDLGMEKPDNQDSNDGDSSGGLIDD